VWDARDYAFLADEHAPPTQSESLRLAGSNLNHGLFQVTDRIIRSALRRLEHDVDRG